MRKSKNPVCGIYSIRNTVNNKVYVGSSIDTAHRWKQHKTALRAKCKTNPHLQAAWDLYGEDKFIFSLLTMCSKEELLTQEWAWIQLFSSNLPENGYNIADPLGEYIPSNANRRKYIPRPARTLKSFRVIDIITSEVLTLNIREIMSRYSIKGDKVHSCSQYWYKWTNNTRKTYKGLIFIKDENYDKDFDYIGYTRPYVRVSRGPGKKPKKIVIKKDPIPYKERNIRRVPVIAHEILTGTEISYTSKTECAQSLGLKRSKIDVVFKKPFKQRSHKGYWFRVI